MSFVITVLYILVAGGGALFAAFELRLLLRFMRHRDAIRASVRLNGARPRAGTTVELPTVTIQIPLYNERTSAARVLRAAAAQDYPRDRFDVQVLDDSTDETPAIVEREVERLQAEGIRIRHLRRKERTGFKAGALAAGLEHSNAEFIAIFDADFTPGEDFLRTVLGSDGSFQDPKVAFVQTRWSWRELGGTFHRALSLLMDRHFFVQKPTKAFLGDVTIFNGSGGIWRRAAIDQAGGWSADSLTEDLDLSYRCALNGWTGRYLHDVTVPNELPADMRALKLQQHRWSRGNAQCFRKLAGRVMGTDEVLRDRWEEAYVLAGYAIHPVMVANLLLWPFAVVYIDRTLFLGLQILLTLVTFVAPLTFLVTLVERGERITPRSLVHLGVGICIGIGLMVVNTIGQIQGLLSSRGEFTRTPKRPASRMATEIEDPQARPYRLPLHWTFFVELLMLAQTVLGAVFLYRNGEAFWTAPLFFWGLCLAVVLVLQLSSVEAQTREPALT